MLMRVCLSTLLLVQVTTKVTEERSSSGVTTWVITPSEDIEKCPEDQCNCKCPGEECPGDSKEKSGSKSEEGSKEKSGSKSKGKSGSNSEEGSKGSGSSMLCRRCLHL